mmetsp:Transcript_5711/g.16869  ORF Transcript_5711/g.16869 Transcript_5711/m.16869 type:complete len:173 (-) Transcript_5711:24-542(-)
MSAAVKAVIRLRCPAGTAKAGPAIGQALGPHGLNMMEFVKEFNAATQKMEPDTPVPVVLTAYANRTFSFVTKTAPTTWLVKQALGIEMGANNPGSETVGALTQEQVEAIARVKQGDPHLQHIPFESLCRSVVGTANSMGVLGPDQVEEDEEEYDDVEEWEYDDELDEVEDAR